MTQKYLDGLTYQVIGAAIEIHKELGPGLLESVYEKCLVQVLKEKGLKVYYQQKVPVFFHGVYLEWDLRYDIMVEKSIIVEIRGCLKSLLFNHKGDEGFSPRCTKVFISKHLLCAPS